VYGFFDCLYGSHIGGTQRAAGEQTENKMKYNAKQLSNGNWAVFQGKRYFFMTQTDSQAVAHQEALKMSLKWHQDQMTKITEEMYKAGFAHSDIYEILA